MLVPLAGAVALAVLLGVAAFVIFNRDHDCSGGKLPLRVVATPDIQPALNKIAGNYNKALHSIDTKCVEVTVAKEAAARTANALAAGKTGADFWVADSSLLMESIRSTGAGDALPQVEGSIATSPVVLAAAKSAAAKLSGTLQPSWVSMISAANVANVDGPGRKVRVLALDPQKNSAGLAALLAAAGTAREAKQDKALVGALKELSGQLASDSTALLASLTVKSGSRVPVGVTSEQAIYAHNTKKPESPVVALYPKEGTLSLDYPVTILTKDPQVQKAAADFKQALTTESAKKTLRDAGFRSTDGKAGDALTEDKGFTPRDPGRAGPAGRGDRGPHGADLDPAEPRHPPAHPARRLRHDGAARARHEHDPHAGHQPDRHRGPGALPPRAPRWACGRSPHTWTGRTRTGRSSSRSGRSASRSTGRRARRCWSGRSPRSRPSPPATPA
ncbi:substrate-binding domain-containing protein [Nonomuraea rubra]|uniref:substrate-binding domain-containing protein n=1 Tax=Nonomuraea rubra TaxID=46180 RepID=UPI00361DA6EE